MKTNLKIIPDQSHTFSKAHHQYPKGISPKLALKSKGTKIYTELGEYTDWSMGLGPVIKGYGFKELNDHVKSQIDIGYSYSLPSKYEFEIGEKLLDSINFGQQIRFARNGSDVTAAAVRLARYFTGKEKIICNGYHGWQDWYIGSTTRNAGVPEQVSELTIKLENNSTEELESIISNDSNIAALIIEPMIGGEPDLDFLDFARKVCTKNNIVFIFDECWTGFRCRRGGAIEYTGIKPDLVCYAKALGNGVPVSAIVGPTNLMEVFEEVFFSFTHSSDPIGLAAADFMLDYLKEDFFERLTSKTQKIKSELASIVSEIGRDEYRLSVDSYPGKITVGCDVISNNIMLKTFIQKNMIENKILFNMFGAVAEDHSDEDINKFLTCFEGIVKQLNREDLNLEKETEKLLVKPVFRSQK